MNDPYTDTDHCVERLQREYKKHGKLLIACDFDDTIFPFHGTNDTHERVLNLLYECQKRGFYITIFTASAPERYQSMKDFLADRVCPIIVNSINENPIPLPFGNHGKVYYNILLDDKAGLGQACDILEDFLDSIWTDPYPDEDRDDHHARLYR